MRALLTGSWAVLGMAEVLGLYATLANKCRGLLVPEVPRILDGVFEVTLSMITQDLENFPEHRIAFFTMLRNINQYCFPGTPCAMDLCFARGDVMT